MSGGAAQFGRSVRLFEISQGSTDGPLAGLDCDALSLVDFEFVPHWNRWGAQFREAVLSYSRDMHRQVYAADDGDGLTVEDGHVRLVGPVRVISDGQLAG